MCGIVGYSGAAPKDYVDWIIAACKDMFLRGPDGEGIWVSQDRSVGLGHRRLAVIDRSIAGAQPMHLKSRGLVVVFNGEIYNFQELRAELSKLGHVYTSNSDTEVLLTAYAQWGASCVERFNGMFAFALYDEKYKTLFLARDRCGEKPLFYHYKDGIICFASELKALLLNRHLPRELDLSSLDNYLASGFVPGNRCILKNFNKLPAAHCAEFSLADGQYRIWRYWAPPDFLEPEASFDQEALIEELHLTLDQAVGRQLRADVPVGVLLSGGIDSSVITALAAMRHKRLSTYTVTFPGYGEFDEAGHAKNISTFFNTEHHELIAGTPNVEFIRNLMCQFDEPIADSSMIPMALVSSLVRKHCVVALGGDGADELFGGYPHYQKLLFLERALRFPPHHLRKLLAHLAEFIPVGFANSNIRTWGLAIKNDLSTGVPPITNIFDVFTRKKLLRQYEDMVQISDDFRDIDLNISTDLIQRATRIDFMQYLTDDLLVKVDRASMLSSLEVRSPYLDFNVIEFAFRRVPTQLKVNRINRKMILKELAKKLLPKNYNFERKQGFSIPLGEWLKSGEIRELFWETLSRKDCFFERSATQSLLKGQDSNRNNSERLFALVNFETWRRHYGVTI
jgi:asparagine synthase (glutamine-hydrolysing)